ncbi:hypothetical protein AURDEDRAFT_131752 [Auricularia subglabra TFB-10046 SS5]|uniref:F-box domain-containing protein n=1 Tax=Auricularia subglabra (strain TFB-10046 / SS5) TaxID=717982 RepID=J0WLV8_AURST|nr:hypothetical protein AURDEDRAFT_131752 [Auricularia subglabra TFB-10046 SS5]
MSHANTDYGLRAEVWFAVCAWVDDPKELSALFRTCKYFHEITGPALYSHIVWHSSNYLTSAETLSSRPHLLDSVVLLTLKDFVFWPASKGFSGFLGPDISEITQGTPDDMIERIPVELRVITDLIPQFSNLQVLTFCRVRVPPTFYQMLKGLPALHTLNLSTCDLAAAVPRNMSGLSLRTLRMSEVRWWLGNSAASRDAMGSLACSSALQNLDVDAYVAYAVFQTVITHHGATHTPIGLRSLRVEPCSDDAADFAPVASFLSVASALEVLHLRRAPQNVAIPIGALPNLRVFSGPAHCADVFACGRPMQHLGVLDPLPARLSYHVPTTGDRQAKGTPPSEIVTAMEKVATTHPPLRRVDFRMTMWDSEVLYMLASLFPGLRDVRISCTQEGPDEDFMVQYAGQFLGRFTQLEALHVYGVESTSRDKPELLVETRGHIGLWERHSPRLQEVAMSNDVIWRKYGPRDWGITEPARWAGYGHE